MIRVLCPRGHFIADVDVVAGNVIPRGLRHGLSWDYAPDHNITRVRARCPRCKYDGSIDYAVLCAEVAQAAAARHAQHRLAF